MRAHLLPHPFAEFIMLKFAYANFPSGSDFIVVVGRLRQRLETRLYRRELQLSRRRYLQHQSVELRGIELFAELRRSQHLHR